MVRATKAKHDVLHAVDRLVDRKEKRNGEVLFGVPWQGYSFKDDTWEKASSLNKTCPIAVTMFNKSSSSAERNHCNDENRRPNTRYSHLCASNSCKCCATPGEIVNPGTVSVYMPKKEQKVTGMEKSKMAEGNMRTALSRRGNRSKASPIVELNSETIVNVTVSDEDSDKESILVESMATEIDDVPITSGLYFPKGQSAVDQSILLDAEVLDSDKLLDSRDTDPAVIVKQTAINYFERFNNTRPSFDSASSPNSSVIFTGIGQSTDTIDRDDECYIIESDQQPFSDKAQLASNNASSNNDCTVIDWSVKLEKTNRLPTAPLSGLDELADYLRNLYIKECQLIMPPKTFSVLGNVMDTQCWILATSEVLSTIFYVHQEPPKPVAPLSYLMTTMLLQVNGCPAVSQEEILEFVVLNGVDQLLMTTKGRLWSTFWPVKKGVNTITIKCKPRMLNIGCVFIFSGHLVATNI